MSDPRARIETEQFESGGLKRCQKDLDRSRMRLGIGFVGVGVYGLGVGGSGFEVCFFFVEFGIGG